MQPGNGPGYQVHFAEKIRGEASVLTGAVGMITEDRQEGEIRARGQADLILMGMEILRNPHFTFQAAREAGDDISLPVEYIRAKR